VICGFNNPTLLLPAKKCFSFCLATVLGFFFRAAGGGWMEEGLQAMTGYLSNKATLNINFTL